MSKPKTQKNDASVDKFLASIEDDQRRTDCQTVLKLMKELTGEPAAMWGKSMVGFGKFHYRGKTSEGDWFHVGFASRKQDLTLYLHFELEKQSALLEKLGKHKIGKSCLYIKKFEDVHVPKEVRGRARTNAQEADQAGLQIPSDCRRHHRKSQVTLTGFVRT